MTKRPKADQLEDGAAVISATIGRRLKSLRTERGWSLDALATRSRVSKGVLVSLEQERPNSNPNLATLVRLAEAFGLPLTHLVEADASGDVRVSGPKHRVLMWSGPKGGTGEIVVASGPPNIIEVWRWEMHFGEAHHSEAHVGGTTELIVVEAGDLTLTVDGEEYVVPAGSTAVFSADRDHIYANTGKKNVVFSISAYIPNSTE